MTKTAIKELDLRLRAFVHAPDNFLDGVGLVDALHQCPVLAAKEPYAIDVEGQRVVPVFTDDTDLAFFKEEQKSAQDHYWMERSVVALVEEAISVGATGLVFNLKKKGDFGNSTIFQNNELIAFINTYTTLLNQVMSDANQAAQAMDKVYFVPVFVLPRDDQHFDRLFPTMSTPEGKSYVPAFTNLTSLAKWYNQDDFGGAFRRGQGVILAWTIQDIYQPRNGDNEVDDTYGVVINPFDEQQTLIDWTTITE
ncbi:SseB family protein [Streptococcus halichoeri]|uniref:SseB family protein n=1 Tax=Streptococcus halichoeri TaxID=254785 RepID=UPI0013591844|nr:SseB family protein [Streptococcus halichoeri]